MLERPGESVQHASDRLPVLKEIEPLHLAVTGAASAGAQAAPASAPAGEPEGIELEAPQEDEAPAEAPQTAPAQARCPRCGEAVGAEAVVCVSCGADTRTGEDYAPSEEEEEGGGGLLTKLALTVGPYLPGLFHLPTLLVSLAVLLPGLGLVYYGLWAMREGEPQGSVAFFGLSLVFYGHAVVWLCTGALQLIHDAFLDMDGHWDMAILLLLVLYGASVGAAMMMAPKPA
jgi:hypothetical protein